MIKLTRNRTLTAIPKAFRPDGAMDKARLLVDIYFAALETGTKRKFKSSTWRPAKAAIRKEANDKCAYCEAPTAVVTHADVEHYRPKSIYWWLAFCYDNYLYSCELCNQTFKSDNFPMAAIALLAPQMPANRPAGAALDALATQLTHDPTAIVDAALIGLWGGEDADLPHPYLEDPGPLFAYEIDPANKEVWLRSAGGPRADRAFSAAEQFLGLNRPELRNFRFIGLRPMFLARAVITAPNPVPNEMLIEANALVAAMKEARHPYAGMCRAFAAQWGL